ncbi:MAG: bacteriohemerythrin [Candidatus Margulisbacteria bacterium]|nr:bacteriohemerythrin [Candidatus Margulisiibacteriota bacterium]
MVLFEWNDNYINNIKECDDQHKTLVKLINTLHENMKAGNGRDVLEKTLSELLDYTAYHFLTEESLLESYGYPEIKNHIKEHEALTAQVKTFYERFSAGETSITIPLSIFLKDWLINHTLYSDKKYGIFIANLKLK